MSLGVCMMSLGLIRNSRDDRVSQVELVVKNPPGNAGVKETWVQSLGWEDPLEEGMTPHSSIFT